MATPHGRVTDAPLVPGVTMPKLTVVERDYTALVSNGSRSTTDEKLYFTTKGINYRAEPEIEQLRQTNGAVMSGPYQGAVRLDHRRVCDMILALSGTSNGRLATQGFRKLEEHTGQKVTLGGGARGLNRSRLPTCRSNLEALSPHRSGQDPSTAGDATRHLAINVDHLKPWYMLTGQHFYLDHDWMEELGENLPVYRPPLAHGPPLFD